MTGIVLDEPGITLVKELAARVISRSNDLSIERVAEGVSTYVYRIQYGGDIFYLRILPEVEASFAPEVRVHALLRERGVKAPAVVYVEHCNPDLQRSIIVTTAIEGRPIDQRAPSVDVRRILIDAGRDLAVINSVPVDGFGWIKRDRETVAHLDAELASYRAFALDHLDDDLDVLARQILSQREIAALWETIGRYDAWLDVPHARLAHGDFDLTHIYVYHGRYSGIIDFGEIRGADPYYDLGHFTVHDGERLPYRVRPFLVEGYAEVTSLPPDYELRVSFSSLFIAVKALARQMRKNPRGFRAESYLDAIKNAIAALQA